MEIKTLDESGINFLVKEEGVVLHPYYDSVHIPTIGVGATYYENGNKVTIKDPAITRERAIELFKHLVQHYELAVYSFTRDDINQNQFNALVSLCYNIGVNAFKKSTLVKRVNTDPMATNIKDAFFMWVHPPELKGRRQRETELYFKI